SARSSAFRQVSTIRCPWLASSRQMARPMPRDPPVTRAVFIAGGVRGSRAQYTRKLRDALPRTGRMYRHAPVDPARHPSEHLPRSALQEHPVPVGDHGFDRGVPDGGMDELRSQELADLLAAPRDSAVRPVEGDVRITDALEARDHRSDCALD